MINRSTGNFIFVLLILIAARLNAQQYDETFAVQSIALSNQSVALCNAFSPLGNPALISDPDSHRDKKTTFAIAVNNKFFLANLKQGGIGLSHRFTKTDAFGLVIQFDGTANLKQNLIALAYSKKINAKFSAGLTVIYMNTFEQTLPSKNNVLGKAGIIYKPSDKFLIGVTVYNPFAAKLTTITQERIPTLLSAGVCYKVSTQVKVYAEYKFGMTDIRNLKLGLSYEPKPGIIIYAGFQNSNSPLSFGFTFKTKSININIAIQYQQVLGFSPAVGFDWEKD